MQWKNSVKSPVRMRRLAPDTPPFQVRYIDSNGNLVVLDYRYQQTALDTARSLMRAGFPEVVCSDVLNNQLLPVSP